MRIQTFFFFFSEVTSAAQVHVFSTTGPEWSLEEKTGGVLGRLVGGGYIGYRLIWPKDSWMFIFFA